MPSLDRLQRVADEDDDDDEGSGSSAPGPAVEAPSPLPGRSAPARVVRAGRRGGQGQQQ